MPQAAVPAEPRVAPMQSDLLARGGAVYNSFGHLEMYTCNLLSNSAEVRASAMLTCAPNMASGGLL